MSFVMSSDYVLVIVNATAFKGSGLTLLCLRRSPAVSGLEPKWSSFEGPFGLVWNRPLHGYMSSVLAAYPFAPPTSNQLCCLGARDDFTHILQVFFIFEFFKGVEISFNVGGLLSLQMLKLLNLTDACTCSRLHLTWRSQR